MLALFPLLLLPLSGAGRLLGPSADILLVIADDVGHADVEEIPTPNIDLLAAQGLSFERAFANPVCHNSRRSLTFGRYWIDSRGTYCDPPNQYTPGAMLSLPKLAQAMGYRTALFGKWHVGSNPDGPYELAPQFHGYDVWRAGVATNAADSHCGRFGGYFNWRRVDDGVTTQSHEYIDTAVRDEFLAWWSSTRGPRLGVVAFQLGHEPFHEPPSELLPVGTPPATTVREKYEHMVQALDTLVGQVLSVAGPEDLVLFLGDNGTPQDVAPEPRRAKTTTFERGIHVPLTVRAPFVKAGQRTSSLVHVADVLATLAALGGRKASSEHSISFLPVLLDPARTTRSFVLCGKRQGPHRRVLGDEPSIDVCVRSQRYKLRLEGEVGEEGEEDETHEEFYDLWSDPEERVPLDLADPRHARALAWHRSTLARYMKTL